MCDAGFTGFTCALALDDDACQRSGDSGATRLDNGMCKCSNYQRFAPPFCTKYAFSGGAYVATEAPQDDVEHPTPVTPPLFRPAAGGNNVACYGRGQLRALGLCNRRTGTLALCAKEKATDEHAPYPCKCEDDTWDETVNCLERTAEFKLGEMRKRCACAKLVDASSTCDDAGGTVKCDLDTDSI